MAATRFQDLPTICTRSVISVALLAVLPATVSPATADSNVEVEPPSAQEDPDAEAIDDLLNGRGVEPSLGRHFCVVDRVAGIQGESDQRYYGAIQLRPEQQRFAMVLTKITENDRPSYCSSADVISLVHWWVCRSDYRLTFEHRSLHELRSDTGLETFVSKTGTDSLTLLSGGRYMLTESAGMARYLEEGRCQPLSLAP